MPQRVLQLSELTLAAGYESNEISAELVEVGPQHLGRVAVGIDGDRKDLYVLRGAGAPQDAGELGQLNSADIGAVCEHLVYEAHLTLGAVRQVEVVALRVGQHHHRDLS